MPPAIDLLIFDLDGTLIDSLDDLTAAVNHMLSALGRERLTRNAVRTMVGQGARRLVERAMPCAASAEIERGLELFLGYNREYIAVRTAFYPGALEALARFRAQGKRMAVISNKNVDLCRCVLGALGAEHWFEEIVGADSLPARKPSPEPVLKLLTDFGVPRERAVIIGDSINDVAAGKGAGVTTVGCTWGYGELSEIADADYLVDSYDALVALSLFS